MKKTLLFLLFLSYLNPVNAEENNSCSKWPSLISPFCQRLHQIWTEGDNELYLSGYAWHNRYTYPKHKIKTYNEQAWGGGVGKGFYDEKGNWHGLVALAFLDSHKQIEPAAGYGYVWVAHLTPKLKLGAGLSVLATRRSDIFNGIPFVGVLPWVTLTYHKVAINMTYIPGAVGAGNVLYIMGKINFNLL